MRLDLAYDAGFDPPAPVVPVLLSAVGSDRVLTPMLLDTGADCTLVPERVARSLGLPRVGRSDVRGVTGASTSRDCHAALVRIGAWSRIVRVVPLEDEAILGRDVLRAMVVRLDGPSGEFHLATRRAPRRPSRR